MANLMLYIFYQNKMKTNRKTKKKVMGKHYHLSQEENMGIPQLLVIISDIGKVCFVFVVVVV